MSDQRVQGPASYFPAMEKRYGTPITEWKRRLRAHPGYGTGAKHMELVGWLKSEHAMGHGHANALVAHTLDEDGLR